MSDGDRLWGDFLAARAAVDKDKAFDVARLLFDDGDEDRAVAVLRWLVEEGHPDAAFQLGLLLAESGEVEEAATLLRVAADGGVADARVALADLLSDVLGNELLAEVEYRRAIEEGSAVARFNLAMDLLDQGRVDEARVFLSELADTGDELAALELVTSLLDSGEAVEAERVLSRVEPLADPEAAFTGGVRLLSNDHDDMAERVLSAAVALGSNEAGNYLGRLYSTSGRAAEAEALYRSELERGNTEVRLNLADLLAEDPADLRRSPPAVFGGDR